MLYILLLKYTLNSGVVRNLVAIRDWGINNTEIKLY